VETLTAKKERSLENFLKVFGTLGLLLACIGALVLFKTGTGAFYLYLYLVVAIAIFNNLGVKLEENIYFLFSEPLYLFAIVLFSPLEQFPIIFLGSLLGEAIFALREKKRYRWEVLFFNPSNFASSTMVASAVFHLFSKTTDLTNPFFYIFLLLSMLVFEVINSFITSIPVALKEDLHSLDLMTSVTSLNFIVPTIFNLAISSLLIWSFLNSMPLVTLISLISLFFVAIIFEKESRIIQTKKEIVLALLETLGARDTYTRQHSLRVSELAVLVAKELKLSYKVVKNVEFAGLLHDLGKINFPDLAFTQKHLNRKTWDIIRRHPEISRNIMDKLSDFNEIAYLVELHHERHDGSGYPRKLKAEEVPIEARILAVVDSFDAMTSHRTYRRAFPVEYALKEIQDYRGLAYDPEVVDKFMVVIDRVIKELEERLKNEELVYKFSVKRYQ